MLFVYLSRSSKKLAEKRSVKEVESLLQKAIERLVQLYPPGEKIDNKDAKKALTKIEKKGEN